MEVNTNKFINILDFSDKLLEVLQVPLYSKQHSGKTYNNHQLFKLVILKSYLKMNYRRYVEFLECSIFPSILKLKRIPHFTTLQKFEARQNIQGLEKILERCVSLVKKRPKYLGIDSTGMSLDCASKHYEMRINRRIEKRDFLKLSMIYDLKNLLITAVKMRKRKRHDSVDFQSMWNKIKHLDFDFFFGDKGYDAEYIHKEIFEAEKISVIFIKNEDLPIWRTNGFYRKKAKKGLRFRKKGRRSLVETINSTLKRVYGHSLSSRTLHNQKVELLFNIITYNLERISIISKNIFLCIYIFCSKIGVSAKKCTYYFRL